MVESSGVHRIWKNTQGLQHLGQPRASICGAQPVRKVPPSSSQHYHTGQHGTEREHGPLGWLHPQVGKASLRRSILASAGGHLFCPKEATRETVVSVLLSLRDSSAMAFPGLSGQPLLTVAFWLVPPVPAAALAPKEQVSGCRFSELSRTFLAPDH